MGRDESHASEIEPFPEAGADADVNDAAEREWEASTTAFERVESVLGRTTEWQRAGEIAERARVSEPTARTHLTTLTESGRAVLRETGSEARFKRDSDRKRLERVQRLADDHSRAELERAVERLQTRLEAFEAEYGVASPDELVERGDEEGPDDRSQWRSTRRNLAFAKAARAFEELRRVDGMATGENRSVDGNG